MEILTHAMPNVKHVMIGMGNFGLREVCKNWKQQLQTLIIQPYAITDVGLTGLLDSKSEERLPNHYSSLPLIQRLKDYWRVES